MRSFDAAVFDALEDGEWMAPSSIATRLAWRRRDRATLWNLVYNWFGPQYAAPKIGSVCDALRRLQRAKLVYLQPTIGKGHDILSAMPCTPRGAIEAITVVQAVKRGLPPSW